MKRDYELSDVERVCRAYVCPYCDAKVGDPCRTTSLGIAALSHSARFNLAVKDGLLPLRRTPIYPHGDGGPTTPPPS